MKVCKLFLLFGFFPPALKKMKGNVPHFPVSHTRAPQLSHSRVAGHPLGSFVKKGF
jgi:hypothetical protein